MTKKLTALFLSLLMLLSVIAVGAPGVSAAPAQTGSRSYDITNPYDEVNWDTWDAYKTQLHVQSIASDGNVQLNDAVEKHYELGYDILCMTDHSVVGAGWTTAPQTVPLFRFIKRERTQMLPVIPLTEERAAEMKAGVGRDGRGMLEVKQGVEMNSGTFSNCHVNGYFADYGHASLGVEADYETAVRMNAKFGGITFLDHLGCYTGAAESEDGVAVSSDPKYVNKFAKLFIDNPTCVGTDINSGRNDDTKFDRVLYDNILQKTIPYGVVPWAFSFSDGHQIDEFERAYTMHVMPEKTVDALRYSMENGQFFSVSRHARMEISDEFVGEGPTPMVERITVNAAENSITLAVNNYTENIVWVANGKEIATGATIDINDYEGDVTSYVRAYLTGPGGICYTQPFTVIESGTTLKKERIPVVFDISTVLRPLYNLIDWYFFRNNAFMNLFKKFALGMTQEQIDLHYETFYTK